MRFFDRVAQFTATTGQGTITLGTAINNLMLTLAEAGAVDGDEITFLLEEGDSFEISRGIVGDGGTTVTRDTVERSKIGGVAGAERMELTGNARFRVVETAAALNRFENNIGYQALLPEIVRNASWTATPAEAGRMLAYNSAIGGIVALPPVASSNGEVYHYRCVNTGALTIVGDDSETIENAAALTLPQGVSALVWANEGKTAWRAMTIWGALSIASPQSLTPAQKGQARGNIGADLLGGFRNKLINGGFEIWQRGVSGFAGSNAYNADRWLCQRSAAVAVSRISHSAGQTAVPGGARYACLIDCTAASTVDNALIMQRIEDVRTLGGMLATWTFYAHFPAGKQLVPRITQAFGGGGSATVVVDLPAIVGTGDWQRYDVVAEIPSVSGKTIGSSGNDYLQVSLVEKAPYQAFQLRTSRHSLVAGDASKEPDPFSPRHIQQELALCQRYFFLEGQWAGGHGNRYATAGSIRDAGRINFPVTMRATPTAAIRSEPTQENCSTPGLSIGADGAVLRVTVTATGIYRAYSGEYTFDAEL